MRRYLTGKSVLWFFLGFAFLLVLSVPLGVKIEYCSYHQGAYKDCSSQNLISAIALWIVDHLDAVAAIATAVATFFIARFTYVIESINANQFAHSHHVERAYISGGGAPEMNTLKYTDDGLLDHVRGGIFKLPDSARIPTGLFVLAINNYGKTPGELDRVEIGFCEASAIPKSPVYETSIYFHDWIGPNTRSRPIWKIAIPSKARPAIFGRLFYRDIFGHSHSSGFINELGRDGESVPLLAPAIYTEERDEKP